MFFEYVDGIIVGVGIILMDVIMAILRVVLQEFHVVYVIVLFSEFLVG